MLRTRSSGSLGRTQEIILHFHEVSAAIIAWQNKAGSDVTAPADRVEVSTSAMARLLASDMGEELLALMREIFNRHAFAERLAYSPEEAAELLGISREPGQGLFVRVAVGVRPTGRPKPCVRAPSPILVLFDGDRDMHCPHCCLPVWALRCRRVAGHGLSRLTAAISLAILVAATGTKQQEPPSAPFR